MTDWTEEKSRVVSVYIPNQLYTNNLQDTKIIYGWTIEVDIACQLRSPSADLGGDGYHGFPCSCGLGHPCLCPLSTSYYLTQDSNGCFLFCTVIANLFFAGFSRIHFCRNLRG